jgi:DNA helicase-2/ATP-dependent DNA helicase PcrA
MLSNKLNPEQTAIASHIEGAILVLAPVGTGKTCVLAERVLHAIREGIPPQRILCLTFTNRAAKEMSERLSTLLPGSLSRSNNQNFSRIVRFHTAELKPVSLGYQQILSIYDDADCIELVKEVFQFT